MTRRHRLSPSLLALAFAIAAALPAAPAAAAQLWLHVVVDEETGGDRVRVNLPLEFVETAVRMVPAEEMRGGKIVIDDADFTAAELRELWRSLDAAGDATLVESESADGTRVTARRSGGYLLVRTVDRGARGGRVDVKIPETVVEALLAGQGDELDLAGALRALAAHGAGELVTVDDSRSHVRVWIDDSAESRR